MPKMTYFMENSSIDLDIHAQTRLQLFISLGQNSISNSEAFNFKKSTDFRAFL